MDVRRLRKQIEALSVDPSDVCEEAGNVVDDVIAALDVGALRVCEPVDGTWVTHAWVKQAILLYFARHNSVRIGERLPDSVNAATGVPPNFYD